MENIIRKPSRKGCKRCAFTGYRPQKMPFGFNENDPMCVEFKNRLYGTIEELIHMGYGHFISGGAAGMDMYAAEAVLDLRRCYPWIVLEMVSPFDGQADRWTESYRRRHDELFEAADRVTVIAHDYSRACMFRRNRYLVENADLMLAAFDGRPGGTAMTVAYARELGVPVIRLNPGRKAA